MKRKRAGDRVGRCACGWVVVIDPGVPGWRRCRRPVPGSGLNKYSSTQQVCGARVRVVAATPDVHEVIVTALRMGGQEAAATWLDEPWSAQ